MPIQADCSHCDYSRAFSPDLSGRFYRCPKCGDGVIAIPRASDEVSQTWRVDHDSWIDKSAARLGVDPRTLIEDEDEEAESVADAAFEPEDASAADGAVPDHKGRVASARKILVECALCQFLVRIPPEFFGKTVHCPNCRGDTMFTESVLEPVKDELIDRLYLESRERSALGTAEGVEELGEGAQRPFAIGIVIGLGLLLLAWGGWRMIQTQRRSAAVMRALDEQWRWAVDEAAHLIHEPWCRDLPASFERLPAEGFEERIAEGYRLHACR